MKNTFCLCIAWFICQVVSAQGSSVTDADDWQQFEEKMAAFAQIKGDGYDQYRSSEKHSWKKAYIFQDQLDLFSEVEFMYGYTNTKLEYIEIVIKSFSDDTYDPDGTINQVEKVLDRIMGNSPVKYGNDKIRQECLICSDQTLALWKDKTESGTKFLEKRFATLEFKEGGTGTLEITFYGDRHEMADFFAPKADQPTAASDIDNGAAGSKEGLFVAQFMTAMKNETSNSPALRTYIPPSFITKNNLRSVDYKINKYSPAGYKIIGQTNNKITLYLWGKGYMWVHKVVFEVIEESGKTYLKPSEVKDGNYVMPWHSIEAYVKVDPSVLK